MVGTNYEQNTPRRCIQSALKNCLPATCLHAGRAACLSRERWNGVIPVELVRTLDTNRNRRRKESEKTNSELRRDATRRRRKKPATATSRLFSKPFLELSQQIVVMIAGDSLHSVSRSNVFEGVVVTRPSPFSQWCAPDRVTHVRVRDEPLRRQRGDVWWVHPE